MKKKLVSFMRGLGLDIHRYRPYYSNKCAALSPTTDHAKGHVLISYIVEPFLLKPNDSISTAHTHHGESLLIARTYLELGYNVDVIDYRNDEFIPTKHYHFFVSARTNFERIAKLLNHDCIKIAHLDTAHYLFNNQAAYARSLALQRRRGVTCMSIRIVETNRAIECADHGALLGGEFLVGTYAYAKKPLYCLPIPTVTTYPFPKNKDYESCRRRFLWFGSSGLVHKGLDLVLEAFAEMPQFELLVCGPISDDKEFETIYQKELYQLPNIRVLGWIDVTSDRFLEIANSCVALVFPSCSESQSASSITCMQAGLLPILSREAGVDVHDFGIILTSCSVDEIQHAVRELSQLPANELRRRSQRTWEYARVTHTEENYAREYRKMILQILSHKNRGV